MASDPVNLRGIILSSREYKEKDRIIKVLTSEYGIVDICVKGTSKPGSKNAFASVPFILCDLVVTKTHDFFYLKDGSIIESNSGIMSSLEAMAVAGHISGMISESVFQSENSSDAYELCVYAFYALSVDPGNHELICAAFNWRLLSILGFAADYDYCADCSCSVFPGDSAYVSLSEGYLICGNCISSKNNSAAGLRKVSLKLLRFLKSVKELPVSKIFVLKVDEALVKEAVSFSTSYMSVMFDRDIIDPIKRLGL